MWDILILKNCPCLSEIQTYVNCPVFYLPTLILRFCWDSKSSLEKAFSQGLGEHRGVFELCAVMAEFLFSSPSCILFHQNTLERFGGASHLTDFIMCQMIPLNFI